MKRLSVNEDFNFDDESFDNIIEPSLRKLKFYRKIVDHFPDLNMFSNCIGKKIQLVSMYKDLLEGTGYTIYGNRIDAPNRMTKLHIGPKENPEGRCTYLAHVGFIQSINLIFDVFSKIEKYMFNSEDMTKRAYKEFEVYRKSHRLHESFDFNDENDFEDIANQSIEKNKFYRAIIKEFYKMSRLHKQSGNEMTIWKKTLVIINEILGSIGGELIKISRKEENIPFPFRFKSGDLIWFKLPGSPFLRTLCRIDNSPVSYSKLFDLIKKIEKRMFNSTEMTEKAAKEYLALSKEEIKALKESFDFEEDIDLDKEIHNINLDQRVKDFAKALVELTDEYGLKKPYDLFDYSIGMMDLAFACEKNLFPEKEGFQTVYMYENVDGHDQIVIRIMNDEGMSEILTKSSGPKITQVINFFCRWFNYPFEKAEKILEKDNKIFLHK